MKAELPMIGAGAAGLPDAPLTEAGLLRLEYLAPPPEAAPFVTTYFRMRCDEREIRDVLPASVGYLAVTARGRGLVRFLDGRTEPTGRMVLLTPTSTAAIVEMAGPWHTFGAALSPYGWAAITGLSAAACTNRLLDAREALPPAFAEAGDRIAADFDAMAPAEMVALLSEAIVAHARPVPPEHLRLIEAVRAWMGQSLSPRVADLGPAAGMSQRQVQRLVDRYFGHPPKALVRKYRALRAASVLADPAATAEEIDAVIDHFYDQSHLIREIRLFAGRTPARIADPDTPFLTALLDRRNFRDGLPRIAPLPKDLRT